MGDIIVIRNAGNLILKKLSKMKTKTELAQYNKEWQKKHKLRRNEYNRIRYKTKKQNIVRNNLKWLIKNPWYSHYNQAEQRCNNIKHKSYKDYGARGIKFLMILEDFKYLWFRDKAYNMKRPSIDRINNNGHYELSNCRFIEHGVNSRDKNTTKLTLKKANQIRQLYHTGRYFQKELGKKFNVTNSVISNIINYRTWRP